MTVAQRPRSGRVHTGAGSEPGRVAVGGVSTPGPEGPTTVAGLRRAVAGLPPGTTVTFPREALLVILDGNGTGTTPPPPDRLLTARQVADRLGVSPKYVYEHARDFPFTKRLSPKAVRFSAQGLARWLART